MNVANQELSLELYKLSGWKGIDVFGGRTWLEEIKDYLPYYNLGYLLRRLPFPRELSEDSFTFIAKYENRGNQIWQRSRQPEDAACKLAIELFKQSILTKE